HIQARADRFRARIPRFNTPVRFVRALTAEQPRELGAIQKSSARHRAHMQAPAVLLSERRYSLEQLAAIHQVDRARAGQWLEWWKAEQVAGLDDDPRSGRPAKLNTHEQQQTLKIALQEPRAIKSGLKRIADAIGKLISRETLRTLLKAEHYIWKRMRRS